MPEPLNAEELERIKERVDRHIVAQAKEIERVKAARHEAALRRLKDRFPDLVNIYENEAEWANDLADQLAGAEEEVAALRVENAALQAKDYLAGIGTVEGVEFPTVDELAGIAPWYGECEEKGPEWLEKPDELGWWVQWNLPYNPELIELPTMAFVWTVQKRIAGQTRKPTARWLRLQMPEPPMPREG